MARINAPRLSIDPVAALPGSAAKGDTVVLSTDGHLYTYDGSAWVDNGAAGGGGGGGTSTRVTLTPPAGTKGQYTQNVTIAGVTASSNLFCTLIPNDDYDADELEDLVLRVTPLAGSADFTILRDGPLGGNILAAYTVI